MPATLLEGQGTGVNSAAVYLASLAEFRGSLTAPENFGVEP